MAAGFAEVSVLIIEDEKFTRMVLARMLGTLGVKAVFQAEDGASGLDAVERHAPDFVLCDVEMAPVDGLGFLRELRQAPGSTRGLPVVLMTNRADEDRMAEARSLGVESFVVKPVTPDTLRDLIARRFG